MEPPTDKPQKEAAEYLPLGLFILGLLLVVIAPLYKSIGDLREVVRDVGLAFLVAGAAIGGVEKARIKTFTDALSAEAKRKLDEIEKTTTNLIFRGPLPRPYYETVAGIFFENRFWRPEWTVKIYLSDAAGKPGFLSFSYKQNYRIRNLYSSEKPYPLDHFEYLYWDHAFGSETTRFDYVRAWLETSEIPLVNESNIPRAEVVCPNKDMIRFSRAVTVPAKGLLLVEEGLTRMMPDHGLDYFVIGEPTAGVTCQVEYPKDLVVDLEFPEVQLKPDAHPVAPAEEPAPAGKRCTVWRFHRPMPPYSYFVIRWLKKKAPVTAAPGSA